MTLKFFTTTIVSILILTSCDRNPGNPNIPDPDDSVTHVTSSDTITIVYENASVRVVNPLSLEGVSVAVNGADVVVTSTTTKTISYLLSGTTSDGFFKIYSAKAFSLLFNGLDITNANGPAINNQCPKAAQITLVDGTINTLTDGITYDAAPLLDGIAEDQGATFFSEGQLIFRGTGTLTINGKGSQQHGLNSDDFIKIDSGTIIVISAAKDGIHANDGFTMSNGNVSVTSSSDGIDGGLGNVKISGGTITLTNESPNVNGLCCDSAVSITGGTITANVNGNQSKGIKSALAIALNGGNITINAQGGVVKVPSGLGVDPSYSAAIKSDASVSVNGATITILHSGVAGKGISTGTDFTMTNGSLTITTSGTGAIYTDKNGVIDAYSATCISANGRVDLLGGSITATSTGTGGKGISANGILTIGSETGAPIVNVSTSGASILNGTVSVTESKAIKSDDNIYLLNGSVLVNTTGAGEGIDSKSNIYMNGGTVVIQGSTVANTRSIDFGIGFNITGGTLMVSGPYRSKTIPIPSVTSTQRFLYSTCTSTVAANTLFHIQDAAATNLVTYKPTRAAYYFIFSSPSLKANTAYSIYTGGTTTETATNGLYTDGVYTAGTFRTTYGATANSIAF